MIAPDGGMGFPYPDGDPGGISAAASGLSTAASELTTAAGQVSSAASAVASSWSGPAEQAFQGSVASVQQGLSRLAGQHSDASSALSAYAAALTKAQTAANNACDVYSKAESDYTTSMHNLSINPPTGKNAATQSSNAQSNAADTLNHAYTTANNACTTACNDAKQAATVCAGKLSSISGEAKDTALHKFLDLMGGPGTMLGALGVTMQLKSSLAAFNLIKAMNTGDYKALAEVDAKGWQEVEAIAAKFGPNSPQALKAQISYEAQVADDAFGDMADAATGLNAVPTGGLSAAFDVLGKIGVVAGVASDVLTLADGQSSGRDKAAAGVNLAGLGMAAAGTEVGESALGLIGIESVGLAVPVVGEILVAGTALYFGGEWVSQHWTEIEHWGDDVGHGVADAYNWVKGGVDAGVGWAENEVSSGLSTAGNFISGLNPF